MNLMGLKYMAVTAIYAAATIIYMETIVIYYRSITDTVITETSGGDRMNYFYKKIIPQPHYHFNIFHKIK